MSQIARNTARLGWYSGVHWLMTQQAKKFGETPAYSPQHPIPSREELMRDLRALLREDAQLVRDGLVPPGTGDEPALGDHVQRLRAMFADLQRTAGRRQARDATTAKHVPGSEAVPEYYAQDFHFQTDGYLSDQSAQLYDVQVETLFYGSAAAMRRSALGPIARFMRGRDQRSTKLIDVACGTGRLLRDVRRAFPAMRLAGLDLSQAYLEEAERHVTGLRPVTWHHANAEKLPFDTASQDLVTMVFMFHELPRDVRRVVLCEVARVLKPGGRFLFIDSLQMGDKPGWDGLLEAFPVRFHEPYFRDYANDNLIEMFEAADLKHIETRHVFLSKLIVCEKV